MHLRIRFVGFLLVVFALVRPSVAGPPAPIRGARSTIQVMSTSERGMFAGSRRPVRNERGLRPRNTRADTVRVGSPVSVSIPSPSPSPIGAGLYSLGGTAVPIVAGIGLRRIGGRDLGSVLVLGGGIAGPALGHLYAGNERQAAIGIGVRSTAMTVVGVGGAVIFASLFTGDDFGQSSVGRTAETAMVGALYLGVGSVVFDLLTAPLAPWISDNRNGNRLRIFPRANLQHDQVGLGMQLQLD